MLASSITAAGIIAFVAHYYHHGFHTLWAIPVFIPVGLIVTYLFLPVLYELKVTSIFEGGLRSVVWADCVQAVIMTGSPLVIIGKILYDSSNGVESPRPLNDLDISAYFLR
ncbi:hypothetical protein HPB52_007814 [Rhipicephalus sanguineus]|uniref:Uncharacterized protein n=1 Tax=Rhipicephalus sanguineus TaxID=34632 RepID=A0A9D4PHT6_RHISA|nr:hypothetical protein HPB52_007814 [Rhipicephalus sanguineus]